MMLDRQQGVSRTADKHVGVGRKRRKSPRQRGSATQTLTPSHITNGGAEQNVSERIHGC